MTTHPSIMHTFSLDVFHVFRESIETIENLTRVIGWSIECVLVIGVDFVLSTKESVKSFLSTNSHSNLL